MRSIHSILRGFSFFPMNSSFFQRVPFKLSTNSVQKLTSNFFSPSKVTMNDNGDRDNYRSINESIDNPEDYVLPKLLSNDSCIDYDNSQRIQPSTEADQEVAKKLLKEILSYQDGNLSSWLVEKKIKILCANYRFLLKPHKNSFLKTLASSYAVDHESISKTASQMAELEIGGRHMIKVEEKLKTLLTPHYSWLFKHMGRLEKGVKFLVDMRTDVLDLLSELDAQCHDHIMLQQLNSNLRELLSLWFSVGFLNLERVTWKSPCLMLQKISEYEAVHPVRNWADLKQRVGAYRRCFVFTHNSMPDEPIVVLHTALSDEISASTREIVAAHSRMSVDIQMMSVTAADTVEDPSCVKAAIFYSITSTQKGLQGIELGNYLIKRVVSELQAEFPLVSQFSSLSPIPMFKNWLLDKIKGAEKGDQDNIVNSDVWQPVHEHLNCDWLELRKQLVTNSWHQDAQLIQLLRTPLLVSCAHYLYVEKRRGYAFDSVANFHLKNGAVMWRLNWLADLTPRGLSNSCGMMVNYRYFLDDTESNSRNYLENKKINATEQFIDLISKSAKSKI